MDLNLQESEILYTFDFGIQYGRLISGSFEIKSSIKISKHFNESLFILNTLGSDYIWCVNGKEDGLVIIKNIKDKNEISLPYHNFGIASTVVQLLFL
jgi:hypothetical protein